MLNHNCGDEEDWQRGFTLLFEAENFSLSLCPLPVFVFLVIGFLCVCLVKQCSSRTQMQEHVAVDYF